MVNVKRSSSLTTTENTITYHNTHCWSQILRKYCLQFLLRVKMALNFVRRISRCLYGVFQHDVTAFQNNETSAMLVRQTSPLGVELFLSYKRLLLFQ